MRGLKSLRVGTTSNASDDPFAQLASTSSPLGPPPPVGVGSSSLPAAGSELYGGSNSSAATAENGEGKRMRWFVELGAEAAALADAYKSMRVRSGFACRGRSLSCWSR